MVNDTEPRYRLVDSNGNVVGSFFAEADGTLKLQEGTSGNDNELSLSTDGEVDVEALSSTGRITTREAGDKALRSVGNGFVGATVEAYRSSPSDKAILNLFGARGTELTPAAIQDGDRIGSILCRGYDGGDFYIATAILSLSTEGFTDSNGGSRISIRTTTNGSQTKSEALSVDADKGISVIPDGSASDPGVEIGDNGAGLFVNGAGEVVVVDESGDTTTLS